MKRWIAALLCALLLAGCLTAQAEEDPWPFYVYHADETVNKIAITVDDCYEIEYVRLVLELCLEYDIKVTFFPIGAVLHEEDAAVWRDVVAMGCEIGSHNFYHESLTNLSNGTIVAQQRSFKKTLNNILGFEYHVRWMRPPYGNINKESGDLSRIRACLQSEGIEHAILWNVSQTDPDLAIKDVRNGAILLYHARKKDYLCLVQLIPQIKELGYEMVTMSELLGLPDPEAEAQAAAAAAAIAADETDEALPPLEDNP